MSTYRGKCRECNNLYHREWRARNPGKAAAYSKRWYEEHKNAPVLDNSHKPVPIRYTGHVGVCRAMSDGKLKVRACSLCEKMSSEYCELGECWVCRECHWKYH